MTEDTTGPHKYQKVKYTGKNKNPLDKPAFNTISKYTTKGNPVPPEIKQEMVESKKSGISPLEWKMQFGNRGKTPKVASKTKKSYRG